jgi:hypothetical protein
LLACSQEAGGGTVECFVPAGLAKDSVVPYQRLGQPGVPNLLISTLHFVVMKVTKGGWLVAVGEATAVAYIGW